MTRFTHYKMTQTERTDMSGTDLSHLTSIDLEKVLTKHFGYETFKEGQIDIISSVLEGKDTLVVQSTGGGKSLCYQLPSLLFTGLTIVITPLISLMEDQLREARAQGRKDVAAYHSGLAFNERQLLLKQLKRYRLLYISPEALQNRELLQKLNKRGVSLFVVDEAHCISQWGHDFRTDYLKLSECRQQLGHPVCVALTATATADVLVDIESYLALQEPNRFIYSVNRENIVINVEEVEDEREKLERVLHFVNRRKDAGMIYFSSRKKAEEVTHYLLDQGISDVAYYHAGMSNEERYMIQEQFLNDDIRLICATNAFGMGVNKPNIRFVIHYHFPAHLESYVQEMGRCSRDGLAGVSYVLQQKGDESIAFKFIEKECLTAGQVNALIEALQLYGNDNERFKKTLLVDQLQCKEQAVDQALYHLEQLNVIETSEYTRYVSVTNYSAIQTSRKTYEKAIVEKIEEQKRKRIRKINEMYLWLNAEGSQCRRALLLNYFSEALTNRQSICCDRCGLSEQTMYTDIDECKHLRVKSNNNGTIDDKTDQVVQNSRNTRILQKDWKLKLEQLWPTK